MTILLVEDETALAAYLVKGLKDHGHAVEHVARGDAALQAATDAAYDLLIVDRMLPAIDGLSLVKRLRSDKSRVPVLFLSNLGGLDDRVEGLNAGADDYLAKPFAFSELLARVNALLRRPHLALEEPSILRAGDLEMDRIGRKVTRGGKADPASAARILAAGISAEAPGRDRHAHHAAAAACGITISTPRPTSSKPI